MNQPLLSSLLILTLLSGCALLAPNRQPAETEFKLPQDPLAVSQQLSAEDRLEEALVLLDAAIAQGWNDAAYLQARDRVRKRKKTLQEELTDRLLIQQSRSHQAQLPLLIKLVQIDPHNLEAKQSLTDVQKKLQENRQNLSDCGMRQFELRPELARECLELSLSLESTDKDQLLLTMLAEKAKKAQQIQAKKAQARLKQARQQWIEETLHEAMTLYEADRYKEARQRVNQVLAEAPDHAEGKKLLARLEEELQLYLANLMKTGDRLYREGAIEGAHKVWKEALQLDPENRLARDKLERAERVLDNLKDLRESTPSETDIKAP
jgi:predicted Zn-dependent protease